MKIIEPSFEIIKYDGSDESQVLTHLEACGRTCYKSDHKIRQGSADTFVKGLMKAGHEAMIEHSSLVVYVSSNTFDSLLRYKIDAGDDDLAACKNKWYARTAINFMNFTAITGVLISGNVRAWRNLLKQYTADIDLLNGFKAIYPTIFHDIPENKSSTAFTAKGLDGLFIRNINEHCVLERFHHKYVSVRFICNRGFTHEVVRMRPCSFAQESTRYVDYSDSSERGKEMQAIKPEWFTQEERLNKWITAMEVAEKIYQELRAQGASPGEARGVLPIDVKTEIVVTTNLAEWYHIFKLRTAKAAHPSMRQLMQPLLDEFIDMEPEIFGDINYS